MTMQIARISCDGIPYALPEGFHKASNLRAFFGVDDEKHLWGEGDKDDSLIPEDDSEIQIETGMKFYTAHKKINQG